MMSPWRFAVHHPVLTVMTTLVVALLGGMALARLPIDLMPDITFPTLSVSSSYSNASPEEMEELVTRPLEEALSSVPGVEELSSASSAGSSNVRVSFAWGTDLEEAANDIRDRIDRVMPRLPDEADRPRLRKFDLASFPIIFLGASSNLDPIQMRRILDQQVKYRIERVPGVASLDVWGGLEREIHVDLDRDKVKALGLALDGIVARVRAENVEAPAGSIRRGRTDVTVRTKGSFQSLAEIRDTVVAVRDGAPVRLSDVAKVTDSWQELTRVVRVNGRPGVRLAVNKQSGTNTVAVARDVLAELERINRDIPQIDIMPIVDSSKYIQRSISNVSRSAVWGGALAVLVLLFFLRDLRSTGIVALAIPVSIIATFCLIYFGGFTLNIMTLGGLALGVGMLLDNAIVVIENIYRLRESGRRPFEAAVSGSGEVAAAVIASTLTTVVVFLPMIFMRGMAGVMFKQLAYVVGFSLLCSLLVALTMVPMLAARATHRSPEEVERNGTRLGRLAGAIRRFIASVRDGYAGLLAVALRHRAVTVAVAVFILVASLAAAPFVGAELMPATDEGEVRVDAEMAVGTRLEEMDSRFGKVEAIVADAVPELDKSVANIGGGGWHSSGAQNAEMRISLASLAERSRSSEAIATDLRRRLSRLPGMTVRTRVARGFGRGGGGGGDRLQVDVRGYDLAIADELAGRVKRLVENVPGVTDARVGRESGSPEEVVRVDRDRAADMGLSVSQVAAALQTALSGTTSGYFRDGGSEYAILVRLEDPRSMSLDDLLDLTVTNAAGEPVALRNVVHASAGEGPVRIDRKDQERVVTVSAEIGDRDMGSVVADLREALRSVRVPRDFQIAIAGDYEEQQKSFRELLISLVLALVLVYMVMAALYESLRDPFVVMFSVPFAAIGVVWMLLLTRTTFNVQSFIGIIMLGGIVVNNAILLVDHTNLLRRRDNMPLMEAIQEAGRRRLRPVLMTSLTTMLGLTPLALGLGEGGEAQAPMARAVIGGLLSSTLITLVLVPTMYSVFERRRATSAEDAAGEDGTGR